MGFDLKRAGTAFATGGLSEAYRGGKALARGDVRGVLEAGLGMGGSGAGVLGVEAAKAAGGAVGNFLGDAYGDVSLDQAQADRARNLRLYDRALLVHRPDPVSFELNPNVERVEAQQVQAPDIAPVERVQSREVEAARLGPVADAVAGQVAGARIDQGASDQVRAQQQQLGAMTLAAARGEGPSVAEGLYRARAADAERTALGIAAQARGSDRTYARLAAMREIADQQRRAALDAANIRTQEMLQARGQAGAILSDTRGTDATLAAQQANLTQGAQTTNAQLNTETSLAGAAARNRQTEVGAQLQQEAATGNANRDVAVQTTNTAAANAQAIERSRQALAAQTTNAGNALAAQQTNAGAANDRATQIATGNLQAAQGNQRSQQQAQEFAQTSAQAASNAASGDTSTLMKQDEANRARKARVAEAAVQGAATAGQGLVTISDSKAKTGIAKDSDDEVDRALQKLDVYSYRYKDPGNGAGVRHGPMADEMAKDPILRTAVKDGPGGKMVDTSALSLIMAGITARKLRQMEGRA